MTSIPLHVLLVEDSEDDAQLLLRALRRGGYDPTYARVDTPAAMRASLAAQPWDLVIADYVLPQFSGPAALALLQEHGLDIPFILVSGTVGEDRAVAALKAGANDFILKNNVSRLIPAIARELADARERRARRAAEQSLAERERYFRALIEHGSDLIAVLTLDGALRYTSPSVARVLGYAPEALDGARITTLVHPDDEAALTTCLTQVLQHTAGPLSQLFRIRHHDSTWRVLDAQFSSLLEDLISPGIIMNARDVTDRTRAEAQIQRQLSHLAALHTIDLAITSSLDLRLTLNIVLDQVITQLHVDAADVLLFNPASQRLEFAAGRGFRTGALKQTRLRLGDGAAGRAAYERRTLYIADLAETSAFLSSPEFVGEGFVAYYGVPLIAKGQVTGVLEIFQRAPLDPDPAWRDLLEALATQAAIAIDNATLLADLQRLNSELTLAYDTTLEGWSRALDLRDQETEGHSQRVTNMTLRLGRALGMSHTDLAHMRWGALLHDIGKLGIPDSILLKPGPLTEAEWLIMRRHPVYAYELLAPITFLHLALDIPYCHHERWDGKGYPRGLRGELIPRAARIFAIADVWDAMRSDRPYRRGAPEEQVRSYISEQAGKHFDPEVVEVFLSLER